MRRLVVVCVVLASAPRGHTQPAPEPPPQQPPAPEPEPTPTPAPPSAPPTAPPPGPTAPRTPAPAPSAPPTTPPATPVVPSDKQTATEQRLAAQAVCAAHDPSCDWIATFSSLERASIGRALASLGAEIEPSPWGKVIAHIRVYNEDVFAEDNWLTFLNHFHVTTRESKIRGELTTEEGQVWDEELVAESARRLKDPLYTGVVALVPIKASDSAAVELLVVTRDIWSLRLNTQYQIQQNTLTNLSISLSENNFLGRRKVLAFAMIMDQGGLSVGPLFIDKNFLGEHLDFRVRLERILTRQSLDVVATDGTRMPTGDPGGIQDDRVLHAEGSRATITLTRPLWSLATEWGGGGSFSYSNLVSRSYFGTGLRAVDDPTTPINELLPREYRMRTWTVSGSATRQWGTTYKSQLQIGHSVSSQVPSLLPTFPSDDPVLQQFFIDAVFPRTELISSPFIEYTIFQAAFRTIRNVDTYELAEDLRVGPNAVVGIQQSLKWLGSDYNFTRPSLQLGYTLPWSDDGFLRLSAGGQIRIQDTTCPAPAGDFPCKTIDNTATGQIRVATPTLGYLRLVSQVNFETRWHDTQNAYYVVGSDSGLRGYNISQFFGDRRVLGQIELRSVPAPVWVVRGGGVVFYEAGSAASSFHTMQLFQDIGIGLRMLVPQTSRELFRFDLAFPLVSAQDVRAGFPRFVAGFDSYF